MSTASAPVGVALAITLILGLAGVLNADGPELYYDWKVSSSQIAPLGVAKQVILINGQFPGPLLNATTNDVVHVNVHNTLSEPFLLTWNGVQQRKNSWQDGVAGTNCPILPGQNWTYGFQMKDQIGSFFYYPSLLLQRAAGGYGPIRINNRVVIPIPFPFPRDDFDILVGDWYNADYKAMRSGLDGGRLLPEPDGILINGQGPGGASFTIQPGATYRLRISNVGLRTTINFRIQGHKLLLVEAEGSYVVKENYTSLDIHCGQSYSALLTADQPPNAAYFIVASSRFISRNLTGVATLRYAGSNAPPIGPLPDGPANYDYAFSLNQARSIRWDLAVGAARPNPQGSYHYGQIPITRTVVLRSGVAAMGNGTTRYTVNGISFVYPDTPLKLADYYKIPNVFTPGSIPDAPDGRSPATGTSVLDAHYRDFIQIVFENTEPELQSWHLNGYGVFVVGMDDGVWDKGKNSSYNLVDAVYRSTLQVYPKAWTAVLLALDNMGMWNIRSQVEDKRYLGQELYMRVKGDDPVPSYRDESPIPDNVLKCGRAASL
uniref:L-ascorbate oxidase n=1 Tax=Anthurium amnicola TaxID=1678845 RepID=A0A1D1Y9N7_9ARAE